MSETPSASPAHPAAVPMTAGRLWALRTVIATAITAVALSGVGGAALAKASDGADDTGGRFGGRPGMTGRNGQLPPWMQQGGTGAGRGGTGTPPVATP